MSVIVIGLQQQSLNTYKNKSLVKYTPMMICDSNNSEQAKQFHIPIKKY